MIHQEVVLPAAPDRVFALLTDAAQFSAMTGKTAEIGTTEGASFSVFGGFIHGRHVELVANERVVQAWRAGNWPAGQYSIVRFALAPSGTGTKLVLDHDGYPDGTSDHLSAGWVANYFGPMQTFLR